MKFIYKFNILVSLLFFGVSNLSSQDNYFTLNYSVAAPLGNTSDFIDQFSWRGISMEGQAAIGGDKLTIGYNIGWQVFNQKEAGQFVDGTQTLTGTQIRHLNAFPLTLELRYHLNDGSNLSVRPYIGVGVGTMRTLERVTVGIFSENNYNWHSSFVPAIGILIPVDYGTMLNLGAKYNYALETDNTPSQSFINLNIGVVWSL